MLTFSVIIPTYNRAVLLPEALRSVLGQTFRDYEVIIVDDGSTDETPRVLSAYGGRITFLQQQNQGPGAARNLGVKHASGEYIAFLDSDDLWFPWTLEAFAEIIRLHHSPAVLSASVREFSNDTELSAVKNEPLQGQEFTDYFGACSTGYYVGSNRAVIRREEFMKAGRFVTKHINAEDHDLALRLGTAPAFVQVLKPVTMGWRRHAGGVTQNVRRTFEGVHYLVEQERLGAYPGGPARAHQRREIICRHIRPVALECLRRGMRREAWELYRMTFGWHLLLRRFKYLAGFWLFALPGRSKD